MRECSRAIDLVWKLMGDLSRVEGRWARTLAAPASFAWQVGVGMESGVSQEEIMGVIVAVAPTVGMAKIVATAPEIAYAMDLELGEIEAAP